MSTLKYGESLDGYGRNKGGRYLHKIRGGEFVAGVTNHALCWADVTRPATKDDYHRQICSECQDRPDVGEWSDEDRKRFERVSVLTDISTACFALEQAKRALSGTHYHREHSIAGTLTSILDDLRTLQEQLKDPEA
jgi:hypothetical protein